MSKKKSKKRPSQPAQPKADLSQSLKEKIQKDIWSTYQKDGNINKKAIKSKYRSTCPKNSTFIHQVVNTYSASLQKGSVKQEPKGKKKHAARQAVHRSTTPSLAPERLQSHPGPAIQSKTEPDPDIDPKEPSAVILQDFKEHLNVHHDGSSHSHSTAPRSPPIIPALEQQMQLLDLTGQKNRAAEGQFSHNCEESVLLSPALSPLGHDMPSQFALLGHLVSPPTSVLPDPRVMLNTNVPFSAFICGLQGSGKSHTTSCIIENCTLSSSALGTLKKPQSTLVLHFNEYSSNVSSQPSEAAFIASAMPGYTLIQHPIPVTVLVSPSNLHALQKMYSQIPNVRVRAFRLQPRHLNVSAMLSLMSLGKNNSIPLYMAQVTRVLREMAVNNGGSFDYHDFRSRLNSLRLDRSQTPFLDQRLDLLDSFLDLNGRSGGDYFVDGGVTILDLSCPFVDRSTACILFRIAVDLFLHDHPSRGKLIVADEAHKYITDSSAANALTETFLNIVRQQRHLGVRLIISTQEPTISPQLIDLCSVTIIHRFSSPEWYRAVRKYIVLDDNQGDGRCEDGLHRISSLRTGEALVFAPSAYLLDENQSVIDVRHRTFQMAVRKRITWDGGQTVMCVR